MVRIVTGLSVAKAAAAGAVLSAVLVAASGAHGAPWGDYRHDYFLPEEREKPFQIYGFLGGAWFAEEPAPGDSGGWNSGVTDRAASGIQATGSFLDRVGYFAEANFYYKAEKLRAGQARADLRLLDRAIHVRGGRSYFPFGIEARSASHRINHFVTRPALRSILENAAGVYGDIFDETLNYSAAWSEGFPSALADSILGPPAAPIEGGEEKKALGGRVGLSPNLGLEIGASYSRQVKEGIPTVLRGVDFSVNDGPLLLTAEYAKLRREEPGGANTISLAYARLGHRIIEYSGRLEAVELMVGFDLADPAANSIGEKRKEYIGGIAVSPRSWARIKGEYHYRDVEGAKTDLFLAEILLFW